MALRYRRPLSIILVGFDPPPGLDEEREHPEELLRDLGAYLVASKRDSDSLSVFDTHTVMMVASEVGIEGARVFLARVCAEATRRLGRTVRGAIVSIPDDGDSVDDLLQEAAASLAFCRSAGVTISDRFFLSGETAAISGSDAPA